MADRVTLEVKGLDQMTARLRTLATVAPKAAGAALYREGERIMTDAKQRTPVDTGALRGSGHVILPQLGMAGIEVILGFGGPAGIGNQGETNKDDVGYAIYVHEDLTASHEKKLSKKEAAKRGAALGDIGEAKFLEKAILAAAPGFAERVAADAAEELGRAK